jgi:hypothetical protein
MITYAQQCCKQLVTLLSHEQHQRLAQGIQAHVFQSAKYVYFADGTQLRTIAKIQDEGCGLAHVTTAQGDDEALFFSTHLPIKWSTHALLPGGSHSAPIDDVFGIALSLSFWGWFGR